MIDQVRRFNRVVTQRAGALDERFLARGRSIGGSRLLWEIGEEGAEVRALRARCSTAAATSSRSPTSRRSARSSASGWSRRWARSSGC